MRDKFFCLNFYFLVLLFSASSLFSANTITKSNFNFGHQLGYIYSKSSTAYFETAYKWSFETGFLAYYTKEMPLVTSEKWKERTMLLAPIAFELYPANNISVRIELTDLFVEFPYRDIHSTGGKSPRFFTKIRLLRESKLIPASAFTVGVKFSSAKPFNIWDKNHNYKESNGLAGAGTGEADYLLQLNLSKKLSDRVAVHSHIGLAPLGSPVEYVRGSGQADEIPYGVGVVTALSKRVALTGEIAGMYNGLASTILAHYSIFRLVGKYSFSSSEIRLNLEKGLTVESDDFVAGFYFKKFFASL